MKQPANDVCISLGNHEYIDVIWSEVRFSWCVIVKGVSLGYFSTRRRAKKAAKQYLERNGAKP